MSSIQSPESTQLKSGIIMSVAVKRVAETAEKKASQEQDKGLPSVFKREVTDFKQALPKVCSKEH
jgi:predicted nucleic acid binding AN1-type Zn finger protein